MAVPSGSCGSGPGRRTGRHPAARRERDHVGRTILALVGQPDVDQYDVRAQLPHEPDGAGTVRRLADHVEAVGLLEDLPCAGS